MDLSSILPLLMGNSGGSNNSMASILSAMNGSKGTGETGGTSGDNRIASLMSMMNKGGTGGGGLNPAMLMPLLANRGNANASGNGLDIVNIMSAMNANKKTAPPKGLQPIKNIVPNDILGVMVKMFNK